MKVTTILIILLIASAAEAARILVACPVPSYSHQIIFRPIWMELARRGHDVTVMTTDPVPNTNMTNLRQIDWSFTYPEWSSAVDKLATGWKDNPVGIFPLMFDSMKKIFGQQLEHSEVQEIINNKTEHFDLVMVEFMSMLHLPFAKRFNAPLIGLQSFDLPNFYHEIIGNGAHLTLYPDPFVEIDDSFWGRLKALTVSHTFKFFCLYLVTWMEEIIFDNFGPGYSPIEELIQNFDMAFVNNNPLFGNTRPMAPSTISIHGGIHIEPLKELPQDLKTFLDNSDKGAIYFSLGSNVKSKFMLNSTKEAFIKTFSELPYNVLWKFDDDAIPELPSNVKIRKWVPQQDVLRHKNIKLFITQGGLQSLEESLFSHVPILCVPFIFDQIYNAQKIAGHGIGLIISNHESVTTEELKEKILDLIKNPKYKNKVVELATRIQDEPMPPLERAMWWTEYVLRNKGAQHLKGPTMPYYKYYHWDIIAFLSVVSCTIVYVIYWLFSITIRLLCGKRRKSKKD